MAQTHKQLGITRIGQKSRKTRIAGQPGNVYNVQAYWKQGHIGNYNSLVIQLEDPVLRADTVNVLTL